MAVLWFQMARQDHGLPSPEKFDQGCHGPKHHTYSDLPFRGQKAVLLMSWPAACDGDIVAGRASSRGYKSADAQGRVYCPMGFMDGVKKCGICVFLVCLEVRTEKRNVQIRNGLVA